MIAGDARGLAFTEKVALVGLVALALFPAIRLLATAVRCKHFAQAALIDDGRASGAGQPPGCGPEPETLPAAPGNDVATPPCTAETQEWGRCNGNQAERCKGGVWEPVAVCSSEAPCRAAPGELGCKANLINQCLDPNSVPVARPCTLMNKNSCQAVDVDKGNMAEGQGIFEFGPNGGKNQQWWFQPVPGKPGVYYVKSNVNGAYCLARVNGKARLERCGDEGGSADSEWEIVPDGKGGYKFKVPGADTYLNVADGKPGDRSDLPLGPDSGESSEYRCTPADWQPCGPSVSFADGGGTFDEYTFRTCHNAMCYLGPCAVPNQYDDIDKQLGSGVRGFDLDIHECGGEIKSCHAQDCAGCIAGSGNLDIKGILQTLLNFASNNPDEIITINLEDYVDCDKLCDLIKSVPGLKERLFVGGPQGPTGPGFDVKDKGWPTVKDMRSKGKNILIFAQHCGRAEQACGYMNDKDYKCENHWSLGKITDRSDTGCRARHTDVPLCKDKGLTGQPLVSPKYKCLQVMNHYRDSPSPATARNDNDEVCARVNAACGPVFGGKPNYIDTDFCHDGNVADCVNSLNDPGRACCNLR